MNERDDPSAADRVPFAVFVLFEAGLAPVAIVVGWMVGVPPLAAFAWEGRAVGLGLLATLPMLLVLAAALRWPIGPLGRIKAFLERELAPALSGCGWPDLALISLAAGIGEEMLFRGVIQGALTRWVGPAPAVVVAGLLFGLFHPVSTAYVVVAGLLGTYLGLVWLATGNLLAVIVAHAVYDFLALVAILHDLRKVED